MKIVRTENAGVFAGEVESLNDAGRAVVLNARRLWFWAGAASLSQLAVDGTKEPSRCKFPAVVSRVELFSVIEVLDVTPEAAQSIQNVPVWSA